MTIHVLLADDHLIVRDGLRALLQIEEDIDVVGDAANGREAVRQAEQLHPDVVVMDIGMPEMNGIEATQQICSANPATRVVILSVYSSPEHVYHALQAGAQGYLLKESAGREMVDAVRCVHSGHRYLSQRITEIMAEDYVRLRQASPDKSPLETLSPSERQVLQLVVEGKSSAEIAQVLSLSVKTVETYRSRLMRKLNITDIPGLVRFAIQQGLTPLE